MTEPLVDVRALNVAVTSGESIVEDVSFSVERGQLLGVVGESGSGKTTVALALLGYARRGARIVGGSVRVAGEELVGRTDRDLRALRGRVVSYVPQEPGVALNPAIRHRIARSRGRRRSSSGSRSGRRRSARARSEHSCRRDGPLLGASHISFRADSSSAWRSRWRSCELVVVVLDELDDRGRRGDAGAHPRRGRAAARRARNGDGVRVARPGGRRVDRQTRSPSCMPAGSSRSAPRMPRSKRLATHIRRASCRTSDHVVARQLHGYRGVAAGVGGRPSGCARSRRDVR